jgi:hypothetical protein
VRVGGIGVDVGRTGVEVGGMGVRVGGTVVGVERTAVGMITCPVDSGEEDSGGWAVGAGAEVGRDGGGEVSILPGSKVGCEGAPTGRRGVRVGFNVAVIFGLRVCVGVRVDVGVLVGGLGT